MYLATNHANLQKSLDRLSSGKRITEPADDAGGLAVSMKLEHTGKVLRGVSHNIANAISFLQTQDGALKSVGDIVTRMGELAAMHVDVTKNTADKAMYDSEFRDLTAQIEAIADTTFNGIALFDVTAGLDVPMSETGTDTFTIAQSAITADLNTAAAGQAITASLIGGTQSVTGPTSNSQAHYTAALEAVATLRANNGGQVRRLQYQMANVETQITNISAANGRIMDVDIAAESSNLARQQVLIQASAAMTAQANVANDVALMLLQ
jgi:flagellin